MAYRKKYIIQVKDKGVLFTTKNGSFLRSPFTLSIKEEDYGYWSNELRGKSLTNFTIREINIGDTPKKNIVVPEKERDERPIQRNKIPSRKKKG